MKKERNMFMKKLLGSLTNLKDSILNWIEQWAGKLHNWAWDRRWKDRDPKEWLREYREWKKKKCPHN